MKRHFPIALLCSLLLSCFFAGTAGAASSYNPSAALAYAAQHWADPPVIEGSDCANFVSQCINAGGCPCNSASSSYLHNALEGSGMGVFYDLGLTNVNGKYRIKASDYAGVLSPGDVVMYYCSNVVPAHGTPRRQYIHTVLYNGMDDNGWLCAYSHTGANNGQAALTYNTTCWVCKQETVSKAVVFHFNDSSGSPSGPTVTLLGTVHDTDGKLAINSRPSAGHEIGTIPEGGVCTVYPGQASGNWYWVEYQGIQGYAYGKYISLGDPAPVPVPPPPAETVTQAVHGTVHGTKGNLAINQEPKSTANGAVLLGTIPEGGVCNVYTAQASGNWYWVEYQGVQGYAYNQYISLGSTHILTHADAVPASCTASGSIEHWYCSVCGERYWDTSGNTFVADVSVPPLGHEYGSPVYTWSEDPSQVGEEVCTCARCGEQETRQIACEILSVSRSGETVTAGISSGFTAVALCAVYDGNGQMLAVRSSDPFRGREEISFSFPDDSFAAAEVFLLDNRSRPLCMSRGL